MSRRRKTRQQPVPEHNVPVFSIDLSLPPRERYKELAKAYKGKIQTVLPLFNALLLDLGIPEKFHVSINRLARLLLRRLHSSVETAEIRGIAEVTGVPMYLLVAFNVVLDLLMGCTSGCVRIFVTETESIGSKMLHFRTLDWEMDPLRALVVQLDFIRSKSRSPTKVMARSITYVGFVGVLTGVRPSLSLSLNFRALHNAATRRAQFRFYMHHLMVLLGLRQSISSVLRALLFEETNTTEQPKALKTISQELAVRHTTAAYLIFCDGQSAIALEKDFDTAVVRQSSSFLVATNHDVDERISEPNAATPGAAVTGPGGQTWNAAMTELIMDSQDRMGCVSQKWQRVLKRATKGGESSSARSQMTRDSDIAVSETEVIQWTSAYPTTNESTHFAAVLDARKGQIIWAHSYEDPAGPS